jgi:hypothetical protein
MKAESLVIGVLLLVLTDMLLCLISRETLQHSRSFGEQRKREFIYVASLAGLRSVKSTSIRTQKMEQKFSKLS